MSSSIAWTGMATDAPDAPDALDATDATDATDAGEAGGAPAAPDPGMTANTTAALPVELMAATVFEDPAPSLSSRVFGTALVLGMVGVLVTAVLFAVPWLAVPRSAEYQAACDALRASRALAVELGRPVRVDSSPLGFRRTGARWDYDMIVRGPRRTGQVHVTVLVEGGKPRVTEAWLGATPVVSGD